MPSNPKDSATKRAQEGYDKLKRELKHLMQSVGISVFKEALAKGEAVFDTRSKAVFERDGIAGVGHLTLEQVQQGQFPQLAKHEAIYLICEYGQVSELLGLYLEAEGFEKVFSVLGGMNAWRNALTMPE